MSVAKCKKANLGYFKTILRKDFSSSEAKCPKRGKGTIDVWDVQTIAEGVDWTHVCLAAGPSDTAIVFSIPLKGMFLISEGLSTSKWGLCSLASTDIQSWATFSR